MRRAAEYMEEAIYAVRQHYLERDITIDPTLDPNGTGLIGEEFNEMTTTLGHADAKRTATNPNMAALIAKLLEEAGVGRGDTIALGCSASFPGLLLASLCAARAMEAHPVCIISLGASSFGANNINFNLLDVYLLLLEKGVFEVPPAAISLGGDRDVGLGFSPDLVERLIAHISSSGIPFIYEPELQKNVKKRLAIYFGERGTARIKAFINAGGSYANIGTSALVLQVKPGLSRKIPLAPEHERGALMAMASRNIPCIHLLYMKGLVAQYGLPWDPVPLPKPGKFN
jgi:poly-gamma-glutamate system protein